MMIDDSGGDYSPETIMADQRREIAALAAKVAELEKDAARYRWIRQCVHVDDPRAVEIASWDYTDIELDSAIDAQMSKQPTADGGGA